MTDIEIAIDSDDAEMRLVTGLFADGRDLVSDDETAEAEQSRRNHVPGEGTNPDSRGGSDDYEAREFTNALFTL